MVHGFNQKNGIFHQSIGAVNTIIRRPSDGKLIGYNTDCEASITAIEDAIEGTSSNARVFQSTLMSHVDIPIFM